MPPNFENNSYYVEIIGDVIDYKKAKNPVTLAIRRFKLNSDDKKKKTPVRKNKTVSEKSSPANNNNNNNNSADSDASESKIDSSSDTDFT